MALAEVCRFLPRTTLMRCAHLSRGMRDLAEALNPWLPPHASAMCPPGSRILVSGKVVGKVFVTSPNILVAGSACGGELAGTLICVGQGCCVKVVSLRVRKVLIQDGARCHLHECHIANPYGIGVQAAASTALIYRSCIHSCPDAGVRAEGGAALWMIGCSVARCRMGVDCHANTAQAILQHNSFSGMTCGVRARSCSPRLSFNTFVETLRSVELHDCGGVVEHSALSCGAVVDGRSNTVVHQNSMNRDGYLRIGESSTPIVYHNMLGSIAADRGSHPVILWNTLCGREAAPAGISLMNHTLYT